MNGAKWIAHNYIDQFRVDPVWKPTGIIQAIKGNQNVDISGLKDWRDKSIVSNFFLFLSCYIVLLCSYSISLLFCMIFANKFLDSDEKYQMSRLY